MVEGNSERRHGTAAEAGLEERQHERRDGGRSVASWRRVELSARDWEILSWAHEQKFLTFEQVAKWFPDAEPNQLSAGEANVTAGTIRRRRRPGSWYLTERLRKLVRFGVLRRVPIFTEGAAALLPGEVGFALLQGEGRSQGLPPLKAIDWKTFVHDRTTTDLRWFFQKGLGAAWRSDRQLHREMSARQVPDAIATLGNRAIALENELTRKGLRRYLQIFERYVHWSGPQVDQVLYVLPGKTDLAHFFSVVLLSPPVSEGPISTGITGTRVPCRKGALSSSRWTLFP